MYPIRKKNKNSSQQNSATLIYDDSCLSVSVDADPPVSLPPSLSLLLSRPTAVDVRTCQPAVRLSARGVAKAVVSRGCQTFFRHIAMKMEGRRRKKRMEEVPMLLLLLLLPLQVRLAASLEVPLDRKTTQINTHT